jgi:1-acyl-sn-glycerol-3-phosphate acyltransferase
MLILARPHASLLDGPAVAMYLRKAGIQKAVFAVDPDYALHPVWSRLLNAFGWLTGGHTMAPLDSSRPFALRTLSRLLSQGRDVVLFPQGTGLERPDRPDAKGVDWLLVRSPQTRHLTLSHVGLFPHVTGEG